jgi:hypothetical protein
VSDLSLTFSQRKHLTFSLVSPPLWQDAPPSIVHLVPAAFYIAPAPAAPIPARSRSPPPRPQVSPPLEVLPHHHHVGAGAARPLSHYEIMSGDRRSRRRDRRSPKPTSHPKRPLTVQRAIPNGPPSRIRIKGQAKVERQRNKMDTSEVRLSFRGCLFHFQVSLCGPP